MIIYNIQDTIPGTKNILPSDPGLGAENRPDQVRDRGPTLTGPADWAMEAQPGRASLHYKHAHARFNTRHAPARVGTPILGRLSAGQRPRDLFRYERFFVRGPGGMGKKRGRQKNGTRVWKQREVRNCKQKVKFSSVAQRVPKFMVS